MKEQVIQLTEKLLQYNRLFLKYYQEGRETKIKKDFHEVIKPFVNEVKEINNEWRKMMLQWVKVNYHKHIHMKQIDTTYEHVSELSVQAFFPETSRTRFVNANRTVEFFLLEILKELT